MIMMTNSNNKPRANINLYHIDNMEFMKRVPDNFYQLAIIDPPYGIGEDGKKNHSRGCLGIAKKYTPKKWDNKAPDKEYFDELIRISKKQIIFGANHFISKIPYDSSCWIVWNKDNGKTDFADCELAWTSFKTAVRKFTFRWQGMLQQDMKDKQIRIHPTEKPIQLYKWLLKTYAKQDDKIFDSHGGSMSLAIACWDMKFDLDACEIDEDYFNDGLERFENHKKQIQFDF